MVNGYKGFGARCTFRFLFLKIDNDRETPRVQKDKRKEASMHSTRALIRTRVSDDESNLRCEGEEKKR